ASSRRRQVSLAGRGGEAARVSRAREGAIVPTRETPAMVSSSSLPPGSIPVTTGDVLAGKYRVDRVLGVGGMGVVIAATHLQLDQRVALKFMLPEALLHPALVERFAREARAAVRLRSDHVARVLDVGTLASGSPYMVMEYLDGSDLGA